MTQAVQPAKPLPLILWFVMHRLISLLMLALQLGRQQDEEERENVPPYGTPPSVRKARAHLYGCANLLEDHACVVTLHTFYQRSC